MASFALVCVSVGVMSLILMTSAADLRQRLSENVQQQSSEEEAAAATEPQQDPHHHHRSKRWSSSKTTGFSGSSGSGGFYIPVYRKSGTSNFGNSFGTTGFSGFNTGTMMSAVPFSGMSSGFTPFSGNMMSSGISPFSGVGSQPMSYIKQVSYLPTGTGTTGFSGNFPMMSSGVVPFQGTSGFMMGGGGMMID